MYEVERAVSSVMEIISEERPQEDVFIFTGTLRMSAEEASERLYQELAALRFRASLRLLGENAYEIVVFRAPPKRRTRPWFNLVLFLLTVVSTLVVGAQLSGAVLLRSPSEIVRGIPFSFPLMAILGLHELAHYVFSRRHRVEATLPYFIPLPIWPMGTLGAVIIMRSPIPSRRALFDIGASGPFTSALVSLPVLVVGLKLSTVVPHVAGVPAIHLGGSFLFAAISRLVIGVPPAGYDIMLHPLAYAGWLGLLVTALNLLPISQLDGGHISYSLFGRHQRTVARLTLAALLVMGFFWPGWWFWALLTLLMGIHHPAPLNPVTPLNPLRKVLAGVAFLILFLSFVPVPFRVVL